MIFFIKLRHGLSDEEIADRFDIHSVEASTRLESVFCISLFNIVKYLAVELIAV